MKLISMRGLSVPAMVSVNVDRSKESPCLFSISSSATPMNRGMVAGAMLLMLTETSPILNA